MSRRIFETAEVPRVPTAAIAANGSIDTTDEAVVSVNDLDMFVAVQLFEDTPAGLSLGKFSEEIKYFQRVERRRDTKSC